MDFVNRLSIPTNLKGKTYNSILVIGDWLIKMVHYKSIKTKIDVLNLAKIIIDVLFKNYGLQDSIIGDRSLVFTSKF